MKRAQLVQLLAGTKLPPQSMHRWHKKSFKRWLNLVTSHCQLRAHRSQYQADVRYHLAALSCHVGSHPHPVGSSRRSLHSPHSMAKGRPAGEGRTPPPTRARAAMEIGWSLERPTNT